MPVGLQMPSGKRHVITGEERRGREDLSRVRSPERQNGETPEAQRGRPILKWGFRLGGSQSILEY